MAFLPTWQMGWAKIFNYRPNRFVKSFSKPIICVTILFRLRPRSWLSPTTRPSSRPPTVPRRSSASLATRRRTWSSWWTNSQVVTKSRVATLLACAGAWGGGSRSQLPGPCAPPPPCKIPAHASGGCILKNSRTESSGDILHTVMLN